MNYYFHVPFCRSKCGYCAFYSETGADEKLRRRYLEKIKAELSLLQPEGFGETVYFGGGTPTLLPAEELEELFTAALPRLRLVPGAEVTMETNPETLDETKVAVLKKYVTRVSLGVQSFDPALRRTLGRQCSQEALERALQHLMEAHFPHWNCDLIYAIPGQTPDGWRRDLERAAQLPGCDHLSCYSLTEEEGARLAGSLKSDETLSPDGWRLAGSVLKEAGFRRYEVSNYAKTGGECRHNVSVWRGGRLTAFGPTGAGFDGRDRWLHAPTLIRYLNGEKPECDRISPAARLNEIFAVNLRTADGWTPERWAEVPHADLWEDRLKLAEQVKQAYPELLHVSASAIRPTERGMLFWDTIAMALL